MKPFLVSILVALQLVLAPAEVFGQVQNQLAEESLKIFETQGTEAFVKFLRTKADEGVDLEPLRRTVLGENGGQPQQVEVAVNARMVPAVEFANEQLLKSGIDFFKFTPKIDASQPDPTEPFKADAKAYNRWRVFRSVLIPMIGFASVLVDAGAVKLLGGGSAVAGASPNLVPPLAVGFAVLGLEMQFSVFSNWWSRNFWSKNQPLFPQQEERPMLTEAQGQKYVGDLNRLTLMINRVASGAKKALGSVERAHVYNYLVNYMYAGVLFTTHLVAAALTNDPSYDPHFVANFVKGVSESFWLTNLFFASAGMNQILLAKANRLGLMTEYSRFVNETGAVIWCNVGRCMKYVSAKFSGASTVMLTILGVTVTLPRFIKLKTIDTYADITKEKFENNKRLARGEEVVVKARSSCYRLLERVKLTF